MILLKSAYQDLPGKIIKQISVAVEKTFSVAPLTINLYQFPLAN